MNLMFHTMFLIYICVFLYFLCFMFHTMFHIYIYSKNKHGGYFDVPQGALPRGTWPHGLRITITMTIIQEQIHKPNINSTAARRSPHRFRRTCCPLPQHLQGSLACLSSGRRPAPGSHCLGRSTAAGREPHRFQGICCPLRLHLQ